MKRVLVVCLGNICRSPIGDGLLVHHAQKKGMELVVDSAGTSGWHQGEPPDHRSVETMKSFGHDISHQRSRAIKTEDLFLFDCILVMDRSNYRDVLALGTGTANVELFVPGQNVPDPYYGGSDGFNQVYAMIDRAAAQWVETWAEESMH